MSFSLKKLVVGSEEICLSRIRGDKCVLKVGSSEYLFRKIPNSKITREECQELLKTFHPNIQSILSYENDASSHYLAAEYGIDLQRFLRNWETIGVMKKIDLMKQCTEGLKYLHSIDIIHKSLEPENILIEKNARLANFGVQSSNNSIFAAPETLKGDYSKLSDIFSLAKVYFYFLLFSGSNQETIKKLKQFKDHLNITKKSSRPNDIEKNFRNTCAVSIGSKMISETPNDRPHCAEILNDILFWDKFKIFSFLPKIGSMWNLLKTKDLFQQKVKMNKKWEPITKEQYKGDFNSLYYLLVYIVKNVKHYKDNLLKDFRTAHIYTYLNKYPQEIDQCYRVTFQLMSSELRHNLPNQVIKKLNDFIPEELMPKVKEDEEYTPEENRLRQEMISIMGIDPEKYFIKSTNVQRSCKLLGKGQFDVFEGILCKDQEITVAIKLIPRIKYKEMTKEVQNLCAPLANKDNIIDLFGCYHENDYYPLVLELAITDLSEFLNNKDGQFTNHRTLITDKQILHDTAKGLMSLHQNQPSILHLDLKPGNILIVDRNGDGKLRACIADFGKSKQSIKKNSVASFTGAVGTKEWFSPEMIEYNQDSKKTNINITTKSDIYQLGLIFGYVLVDREFHTKKPTNKKKNPNEKVEKIKADILEKFRKDKYAEGKPMDYITEYLIKDMIQIDAEQRIDAESVVKNPMFWNEDKLEKFFIQIIYDHKKAHNRNKNKSEEFVKDASRIVFANRTWMDIFGSEDMKNEMTKCPRTRSFNVNSYLDLIDLIIIVKNDNTDKNFPKTRILSNATDPVKFWEFWFRKLDYLLVYAYCDMKVVNNRSEYYSDIGHVKKAPKRKQSCDLRFKPPIKKTKIG